MQGHLAHDLEEKSRTEDVLVVQDVVFQSMLLPDFILRGLEKAGFKKPSPVQLSAIPLARCGLGGLIIINCNYLRENFYNNALSHLS